MSGCMQKKLKSEHRKNIKKEWQQCHLLPDFYQKLIYSNSNLEQEATEHSSMQSRALPLELLLPQSVCFSKTGAHAYTQGWNPFQCLICSQMRENIMDFYKNTIYVGIFKINFSVNLQWTDSLTWIEKSTNQNRNRMMKIIEKI